MTNKEKPIIGIMPLFDMEKDSIWMLPDYMNAVLECGGIPVIFPITSDEKVIKELSNKASGFIFTGGPDVDPSLYNQEKLEWCGSICACRDTLEMKVLKEATKLDKPILGICRGFQIINVFFGGTLYQDLPSENPSYVNHRMDSPNNRYEHSVNIEENTITYSIFGKETMVNSCHHQGVKKLGDTLKAVAWANDGLIEAFERPGTKFTLCVQWHPERLYLIDDKQKLLFKKLVEKSKE